MSNDSIHIVVGGDVCPSGEVGSLFTEGNSAGIFHDLLPIMKAADYIVVNLECPLTQHESPISKDGAALRAPVNAIKGLKNAKINAVNLANNHILDHDEQGILSTINILSEAGISYFGAGSNLTEANKPHIVSIEGKKIAFVGIAEHEFSIACNNRAGANPLDVIENARLLRKLRQEVDYIVVLFHGGKEHYPYPTPNQQKFSRFLVEEGADAVISQHSHIAGSYELYKGKLIVYGQGNFIFEKVSRDYATCYEGFLVSLSFGGDEIEYELIPYEQSRNVIGAQKLRESKGNELLERVETRSKNIRDPEFVNDEWRKLCAGEALLFKSRLLGHNRYLRRLNGLFNFSAWLYPRWKINMIRNVVECETHREGLETLWSDKNNRF